MAKARKQKLKVFVTPIGFHDAFVAAPSQKAALEAWGADANLFAHGIAQEVTDAKLTEEPLANPGKVIKRIRGSADEHFAALAKDRPSPRPSPAGGGGGKGAKPSKRAKPKPRPSRAALDAAEDALENAEKKQRKAVRKIDERIQELERERRELQRRNEAERDKLSAKAERARSDYEEAMRDWKA